jgi:hypothetical protein
MADTLFVSAIILLFCIYCTCAALTDFMIRADLHFIMECPCDHFELLIPRQAREMNGIARYPDR